MLQALAVERMQHGVARPVGGRAGPLGRRAVAELGRHPTKRTLINLAFFRTAEWHTELLQLQHGGGRFTAHIFNGILIAEPVGPLDGVKHMPLPVIFPHIAEGGGDTALRRHGMAAGRKHLGDRRRFQSGRRHAHGRAQARAARTDDNHVIFMFDYWIGF